MKHLRYEGEELRRPVYPTPSAPAEGTPAADLVCAVGTYLLDERRIRPSEEAFLLDMVRYAREHGPDFRMTARQLAWWDDILDNYDIADGVVPDEEI